MALELTSVTLDAHDPARVSAFWGSLLGREVADDPVGTILPGSAAQVGLRFTASRTQRVDQDPVHLHLSGDGPGGQDATVAAALGLGATPLDVGQRLDEGHVVLADPDGNAFCVIEPGNSFLAGCGSLAELACDGSRDVGLFWSAALAWPLVWDHDQETAVQSPHGGTKVAWGGPSERARTGRNRQRLDLTARDSDLQPELVRLEALGATRLGELDHGTVELADPDGNEFWVRPGRP